VCSLRPLVGPLFQRSAVRERERAMTDWNEWIPTRSVYFAFSFVWPLALIIYDCVSGFCTNVLTLWLIVEQYWPPLPTMANWMQLGTVPVAYSIKIRRVVIPWPRHIASWLAFNDATACNCKPPLCDPVHDLSPQFPVAGASCCYLVTFAVLVPAVPIVIASPFALYWVPNGSPLSFALTLLYVARISLIYI